MNENLANFEATKSLKKRHNQLLDSIKKQVAEGTMMIPGGRDALHITSSAEKLEKLEKERVADQ